MSDSDRTNHSTKSNTDIIKDLKNSQLIAEFIIETENRGSLLWTKAMEIWSIMNFMIEQPYSRQGEHNGYDVIAKILSEIPTRYNNESIIKLKNNFKEYLSR